MQGAAQRREMKADGLTSHSVRGEGGHGGTYPRLQAAGAEEGERPTRRVGAGATPHSAQRGGQGAGQGQRCHGRLEGPPVATEAALPWTTGRTPRSHRRLPPRRRADATYSAGEAAAHRRGRGQPVPSTRGGRHHQRRQRRSEAVDGVVSDHRPPSTTSHVLPNLQPPLFQALTHREGCASTSPLSFPSLLLPPHRNSIAWSSHPSICCCAPSPWRWTWRMARMPAHLCSLPPPFPPPPPPPLLLLLPPPLVCPSLS